MCPGDRDFEEPKARIQCLRGDLLVLSRGGRRRRRGRVAAIAVIVIAVDTTRAAAVMGVPFK